MRCCLVCGQEFPVGELDCRGCGQPIQVTGTIELHAPEVSANDGYDTSHFAELAAREPQHFWFNQRNRIILDFARQHFSGAAKRYMEIGCGTGYVLQAMRDAYPDWRTWGSELHTEGLHYAAQRLPDSRFLQMDARRIPFSGEFDLIGCFDVLEHIEEDESVLAAIHRSLQPEGGLLVTVPQHPALWSSQDEAAHHVRRYRRHELEEKLRRNGFDVIRSASFVTLLLPAMLASRFANRISAAAQDPLREVRVGPVINTIGSLAMAADRAILRSGVNLPVGGSRIIAARRSH